MSSPPVVRVAVTVCIDRGRRLRKGYDYLYVSRAYAAALDRAGALPLLVSPDCAPEALIQSCDALVITGGDDLPRSFDGQDASITGAGELEDLERVAWERRLLDLFQSAGKPVLGICYGMQLMNLHFGGTLHVDLRQAHEGAEDHGGGGLVTRHEIVWFEAAEDDIVSAENEQLAAAPPPGAASPSLPVGLLGVAARKPHATASAPPTVSNPGTTTTLRAAAGTTLGAMARAMFEGAAAPPPATTVRYPAPNVEVVESPPGVWADWTAGAPGEYAPAETRRSPVPPAMLEAAPEARGEAPATVSGNTPASGAAPAGASQEPQRATLPPRTLTRRVFASQRGIDSVNSSHRQAVDGVAPGFHAAARASDGFVEAIECGLLYGVEWHPETDPAGDALFRAFIGVAAEVARPPGG